MDGGQNLGFGRGGLGFGPAYQSLVPVPDGTVGPIRTSRRRYIEMAFMFDAEDRAISDDSDSDTDASEGNDPEDDEEL